MPWWCIVRDASAFYYRARRISSDGAYIGALYISPVSTVEENEYVAILAKIFVSKDIYGEFLIV